MAFTAEPSHINLSIAEKVVPFSVPVDILHRKTPWWRLRLYLGGSIDWKAVSILNHSWPKKVFQSQLILLQMESIGAHHRESGWCGKTCTDCPEPHTPVRHGCKHFACGVLLNPPNRLYVGLYFPLHLQLPWVCSLRQNGAISSAGPSNAEQGLGVVMPEIGSAEAAALSHELLGARLGRRMLFYLLIPEDFRLFY